MSETQAQATASQETGSTATRLWEGCHSLKTSDGTPAGGETCRKHETCWKVVVYPASSGVINRCVSWGPNEQDRHEWDPSQEPGPDEKLGETAIEARWYPETTIWPTWSPPADGSDASSGTPLEGVHSYWRDVGDRLRESAKWMAAVLGAALAALIGTSPLAGMRKEDLAAGALVSAAAGLVLLGVTLFMVLQVMRPQSVSYADVQASGIGRRRSLLGDPLRRWKDIVETQQDLYLPTGVKCLTSLRQAMIIEDLTLIALARAMPHAAAQGADTDDISKAQQAGPRG